MSEILASAQSSRYASGEKNMRLSQTAGKSNFKSFVFLRQGDDRSTKLQNSLQKTLDRIHNKSNDVFQNSDQKLHHTALTRFDSLDFTQDQNKFLERRTSLFEKENSSLRNTVDELRFENRMIRSSQSPVRIREALRDNDKTEQFSNEIDLLRQKLRETTNEKEALKAEISQIKAESLNKYEQLKKKNDDLLVTYEERVSIINCIY